MESNLQYFLDVCKECTVKLFGSLASTVLMSLWIRMIRISDSSKRKLCKLKSYSLTYLKNYPLMHQWNGMSMRKSITLLF